MKKQRGWINRVCITGDEPTLHSDLSSLFSKLREMSFLVKIDTNGTNPMMVKGLIGKELVDCIVMDIKAPCDWEKYSKAIGINADKLLGKVKETVGILSLR